MGNLEVIKKFLLGEKGATPERQIVYSGSVFVHNGRTLQTDGQQLINYRATIAKRNGENEIEIDANYYKYSATTTKIMKALCEQIKKYKLIGYDFIVVLNGEQEKVEQMAKLLKEN